MENVVSKKSNLVKRINLNPKRTKRYKTSSSGIDQIKELQQTIGNLEVTRLIESGKIDNVLNGSIDTESENQTNTAIEDTQNIKSTEENKEKTDINEVEEIIKKLNEAIDIAYSNGLINTGNFLYHFLENNGHALEIDVDSMIKDIKKFNEEIDSIIIEEAKENAFDVIKESKSTKSLDFELTEKEKKYKFLKSDNNDYFNILNKFNYTYQARVITFSSSDIPDIIKNSGISENDLERIKSKESDKLAFMKLGINIDDRFDEYLKNPIFLGKLEIRNEDLLKLTKNEMAKGFKIIGSSSDSYIIWEYDTPLKEVPEEEEEIDENVENIDKKIDEDIEEDKVKEKLS
jgi:hypothetical protein